MNKETRIVWGLVALSTAYATLRYNVFKGEPWSDWPVLILNKAVALAALLLIVSWILRARRDPDGTRSTLLAAAGSLALVHAGLSLAVLSPAYFPSFFQTGRLTGPSGLSLLVGVVIATALLVTPRHEATGVRRLHRLGIVGLMAGIHALLNGYASWLAPATWPGSMPPITLISAAAGAVAIAAAWGTPPVNRHASRS